jgi:hypothetical protein
MVLAVAGLIIRGRARLCWSFLAYLTAVMIGDAMMAYLWPERFLTHEAWITSQTLYAMLRILVAFEIAAVAFQAFPRARTRVLVLLAIIGSITAFVVASPVALEHSGGYMYLAVAERIQPALQIGSLWLFVAIIALAGWHVIPLHPFHRDVVTAFVLYLAMQAIIYRVLDPTASAAVYARSLLPAMYGAAVGVWAWAAWRPEREPATSRVTMRKLQPWAGW